MWYSTCTKEVWIIEYSAHVKMYATCRRTSCLLVNRALWVQILTWQENHWETIGNQRWQLARTYMGPDMNRVLKLAGWTDGSCNVRRHASVRIAFTILTGGLMDWMIRNVIWNWESHDKHDQYSGKEWPSVNTGGVWLSQGRLYRMRNGHNLSVCVHMHGCFVIIVHD